MCVVGGCSPAQGGIRSARVRWENDACTVRVPLILQRCTSTNATQPVLRHSCPRHHHWQPFDSASRQGLTSNITNARRRRGHAGPGRLQYRGCALRRHSKPYGIGNRGILLIRMGQGHLAQSKTATGQLTPSDVSHIICRLWAFIAMEPLPCLDLHFFDF